MDNRLFLIDGHALIFKMYYAFLRHPMINSKGADMSILFGFTKYILELIEKEKPTHFAIAFDPPGGTFRHEMYPEYKGTRSETPQLVIDSLEPLCELCKAMDFPVLMVKGFEADDVIGSMAKRAEKEGFVTYMVTPDKDYGQLISPSIFQYKPGKSGNENELIDVDKICQKYNISRPEQVIDILTIVGDSSDNVPGVKGVGEVGAGKLISKYGSVSEIYAHIDELTPKQREAFENAKGHIDLSNTLVTIKTDIPLEVTAEDMEITGEYSPEVADLFEKYEFGSLKKYLGNIQGSSTKEEKHICIKESSPELIISLAAEKGECAVIVEGEGAGIFTGIRKATIAVGTGELESSVAYGDAESFSALLSDSSITKYGYDLKYQRDILRNSSMDLCGKFMDIELMHYLIDPEKSHKLDILTRAYLDVSIESNAQEETKEQLSLFDEVSEEADPSEKISEAAAISILGKEIRKDLVERGLESLYDTMEEPLMKVLSDMELEGVKIDTAQLRKFASSLSSEMNEIQERVREMAQEPELNIMSPKQIGTFIYEKLNLPG